MEGGDVHKKGAVGAQGVQPTSVLYMAVEDDVPKKDVQGAQWEQRASASHMGVGGDVPKKGVKTELKGHLASASHMEVESVVNRQPAPSTTHHRQQITRKAVCTYVGAVLQQCSQRRPS